MRRLHVSTLMDGIFASAMPLVKCHIQHLLLRCR